MKGLRGFPPTCGAVIWLTDVGSHICKMAAWCSLSEFLNERDDVNSMQINYILHKSNILSTGLWLLNYSNGA